MPMSAPCSFICDTSSAVCSRHLAGMHPAFRHVLPMLDGALTKIGVQHMKKMGIEFHLECALCSR